MQVKVLNMMPSDGDYVSYYRLTVPKARRRSKRTLAASVPITTMRALEEKGYVERHPDGGFRFKKVREADYVPPKDASDA